MPEVDAARSFADASEWRRWLAAHYALRDSVWVVITKQGVEPAALQYNEAVEVALCFGWIDSTLHRIDDRAYALRFGPRRPGSIWAESNKRRVTELVRAGRMAPPGLAAMEAAMANGQWDAAARREQVDEVPTDLESALMAEADGVDAYLALRASRRKQLLYWLESAKRPQTRASRIRAIVDEAISGGT